MCLETEDMGLCACNCKATNWRVIQVEGNLHGMMAKSAREEHCSFYSVIMYMKVSYYTVEIFSYELNFLLCCFRLSSHLTVEGRRNLFIDIKRIKTRNLRCRLLSISTGKVRHTNKSFTSLSFVFVNEDCYS